MGSIVFGKRLRQERKRFGISQQRLGEIIGIDSSNASPRINRYEQGTRQPHFAVITKIADSLDVPPSYLCEPNDELAGIILLIHRMDENHRKEVYHMVREIVTLNKKTS